MTITTEQFIAVNVGSAANDGTGDTLRDAFTKVNENFSNIATVGFNTGNINVDGDIETSGNITAGQYFIGDGTYLTNVVGTYNNASVAAYLPTYSGNIGNLRVTGSITRKSNILQNVSNVGTTVLDFTTGGTELLLMSIVSNVQIDYSANITAGREVTVSLKNTTGTNYFLVLPNANNNKGTQFIGLTSNVFTTIKFISYSSDSANVVAMVANV